MERVSLVDYPGLTCSTLFVAGCNFGCPWCYNQDLITPEVYTHLPDIDLQDVKEYLLRRKGLIQAVTVTGGEPGLSWELLTPFLFWCQTQGFKCKIDTNGYRPDIVSMIIESGLIDFIAMDIKNTWAKYGQTVGILDIEISRIQESIKIIKDSGIEYQFRSTIVPHWVKPEDIDALEDELDISITRQGYASI